jgi:hypothetical protein
LRRAEIGRVLLIVNGEIKGASSSKSKRSHRMSVSTSNDEDAEVRMLADNNFEVDEEKKIALDTD